MSAGDGKCPAEIQPKVTVTSCQTMKSAASVTKPTMVRRLTTSHLSEFLQALAENCTLLWNSQAVT